MEGDAEAAPIDDFWTCSADCLGKYQEASEGWSEEKISRVKQWQEQAVKEAIQQPVTVKAMLRKLLPLWILIAINIFVITGLVSGYDPNSDMASLGTPILAFALIILNVIYLIVWERITRKDKKETD